jgi:hypothetical protein
MSASTCMCTTPDNSQDATIDQYWQVWFLLPLLGIIGTTLLLVGIALGRRHVWP